MDEGYAICIDTNACRDGSLTRLELQTGHVWQAVGSESVRWSRNSSPDRIHHGLL